MKITLLGPVQHDGKSLEVGDTIDMDDGDARGLVNYGAAKAVRQKADSKTEQKLEGDQQQEGAATGGDKAEGDAAGQFVDASAAGATGADGNADPANADPAKAGAQE